MLLFVVGPVDPEAIIRQVRENQQKKPYTDQPEIVRKEVKEPGAVFKKEQEIKMNVQSSKCLVGLKSAHPMNTGEALLKHELTINLILECLFGKSSSDYERIYEKGYIDETFSYDYTEEHGFGFVSVGGDTPEPDKLAEELKQVLFKAKETITAEKLELARKKKIGNFLKSMNSPEYIANQFTRYAFLETSLFDIVTVLESITLDDVHRVIEEEVEEDRITVCKVVPKS
ncbi:hypothetical protein CHCC14596_0158 [Bacillus licheniformis]|nr:hypothetical protein CHCC14596_0158 [Bacillus licheniformis]